jgi:hypothetical protein
MHGREPRSVPKFLVDLKKQVKIEPPLKNRGISSGSCEQHPFSTNAFLEVARFSGTIEAVVC